MVRTSAPAHDRQALLLKGILAVLGGSGSVFTLSGLGDWAAPWSRTATKIDSRLLSTNTWGTVLAWRSNKAMQLTRGGWRRGVAWCAAFISWYGCHREGPSKVAPLAADRRC